MIIWSKFFDKAWPFILMGLMAVALWDSYQRTVRYKNRAKTLETTISDMGQQIKQTKIRLNDSVELYQAEVKALKFTKDNLKARYNELLQASKLKPKDVSSITQIGSSVASVDTVIAEVDTFGGLRARLKDNFVRIDVDVRPDRKTIIDYTVRDSLSVICVQKQHRLLFGLIKWKSAKSVRVINHNPKARIGSLQTINVIE